VLNAGDRLVEVPDGWVSDSYSISGVKWLVIYSPEKGIKKLYIKDVFVCETEADIFYFQQDEGPFTSWKSFGVECPCYPESPKVPVLKG